MRSRRYSRLESVEEKKNVRSAVILIILSIAVVVFLVFVGIPTIGKVATFVSGLKNGNKTTVSTDKTPPAPPNFNAFPDFTNQSTASISGTAEPGATIKLTFNGTELDSPADKDGNFSFNSLNLQSGTNTFSAVAVDAAGNVSQPSGDQTITYNNKPPSLTVASPTDGSNFFGTSQMQVTIQGTTDSGAGITINDRIVSVDDTGAFQYSTTLSNGQNKFAVIATDQAGNTTEKDITLNFSN
jgi:hypothetical protein